MCSVYNLPHSLIQQPNYPDTISSPRNARRPEDQWKQNILFTRVLRLIFIYTYIRMDLYIHIYILYIF